MAAYLTKPVKPGQLLERIASVLALSLPLAPAADAPPPPGKTRVAGANGPRPGRVRGSRRARVLVADDHVVNQRIIQRQLEKLGYRCDVVANGLEAVEALGRVGYDAILMDCQMPEMDGYDAARTIRRSEGESLHTPVIAMTAHALAGDRERCLTAGMDDYLTKPVRLEDLERVLARWAGDGRQGTEGAEGADPPVDMQRLLEFGGEDAAEMEDLVRLSISEMEQQLEGMASAIAGGSPGDLYRAAHKCVGGSATAGMVALLPSLRELERMARQGDLADAEAARAEAVRQLERIRSFFASRFAAGAGASRSSP